MNAKTNRIYLYECCRMSELCASIPPVSVSIFLSIFNNHCQPLSIHYLCHIHCCLFRMNQTPLALLFQCLLQHLQEHSMLKNLIETCIFIYHVSPHSMHSCVPSLYSSTSSEPQYGQRPVSSCILFLFRISNHIYETGANLISCIIIFQKIKQTIVDFCMRIQFL